MEDFRHHVVFGVIESLQASRGDEFGWASLGLVEGLFGQKPDPSVARFGQEPGQFGLDLRHGVVAHAVGGGSERRRLESRALVVKVF